MAKQLKSIGFLVIFLSFSLQLFADGGHINLPVEDDLFLTYKKGDQKRMEKANKIIKENRDKIQEAVNLFQPVTSSPKNDKASPKEEQGQSDVNKAAFLKLKELSDIFQDANETRFETNKKYITNFWEKLRAQYVKELAKAKTLEIESNRFYKLALNRRQQALITSDYTKAYIALADALELEFIAIQKQSRALRKYQDWPVVYPYVWEDNVKPFDPNAKFNTIASADTGKNNANSIVATANNNNNSAQQEIEDEIPTIIFKVQIAAHTTTISNDELKLIYQGKFNIDMIYEDGWYKYSIGAFKDDYIQAQNLLRNAKVGKAFVVAYQNGKKLKIKEAMRLADEKLSRRQH
jgi:hypothetical protein